MSGKGGQLAQIALAVGFGGLVVGSFLVDFGPGRQMGQTFASTALALLGLLPNAFVLIALFDVWVKRETIEQHLGTGSGIRGYFWIALLAGMTVGGLYVAFPVASSLANKGARLSIVFAYVGLAGICRIPMLMYEASFLGWHFTAIRLIVAAPLIVLASAFLGHVLQRRGYTIGPGP